MLEGNVVKYRINLGEEERAFQDEIVEEIARCFSFQFIKDFEIEGISKMENGETKGTEISDSDF
ncbi:MAG: hypothetical protein RBS56_01385 [Candidatus Gracilibacteria bacterium]|jgi:hypothetical protein|nr:hypothetical protein [Candidatus Gracilibacteria bacterium]